MFETGHLALAYLTLEWVIRIIMIFVIPLRRPPEAARSWLLLVFFLPVPALVLYRLIGRPAFPQWRRERFERTRPEREKVAGELAQEQAEPDGMARLAARLGGLPACGGNDFALLTGYDAAIEAMVRAIDGAASQVHLTTYIFADDDTGRRIAGALERAVRRGVKVRVLIDALGSRPWASRSLAMLEAAGVEARLALPIRFASLRRTRSDLRNHRKLCVVDGRIAFVGSQNIVDRDFKPGVVNDELVARVEGRVVAAFESVFVSDWYLETEESIAQAPFPQPCGDTVLQAMPSGPDYRVPGYEQLLVEMVHGAQERITIVSPYLVPDEALLTALKNAVLREVRVDLILSRVIDQRLVRLAQRSYYDELLKAGVQIHRYRERLLHAKSIAVDDRLAVIGSSNADVRSFVLNAEISLILYGASATGALEAVHTRYRAASDLLTLEQWRGRAGYVRLAENLVRLLSPLL